MKLSRLACLCGAVVVVGALFRPSVGQQFSPTVPFSPFGVPSIEVGGPRLIPGFDMKTLPVGKVIGKPATDARVREALGKPAEFNLEDIELGDFVKQVAEKHQLDILLDIAALTADGKGTETVLNFRVRRVTLGAALQRLLDDLSLTYIIRNESLEITTKTAAETFTSTRIYQVQDLVVLPNDPAGRPDFESLIELLTSTLTPESWREAGGTVGEVKAFSGPGAMVLVVTQTDAGHEEVEKLLTDLRAAQLPAVYDLQQHRMRTGRDPAYPSNFGLGGALTPAPSASGS